MVVRDASLRAKLADAHPYAATARKAPVCVVACGVPNVTDPDAPAFWTQNLSATVENMLLAATGLGLGAVWCGVYPRTQRVEAVRQLLDIPSDVVPFAYAAVGHPAKDKRPRTQYDPARVHHDRW